MLAVALETVPTLRRCHLFRKSLCSPSWEAGTGLGVGDLKIRPADAVCMGFSKGPSKERGQKGLLRGRSPPVACRRMRGIRRYHSGWGEKVRWFTQTYMRLHEGPKTYHEVPVCS